MEAHPLDEFQRQRFQSVEDAWFMAFDGYGWEDICAATPIGRVEAWRMVLEAERLRQSGALAGAFQQEANT